MTQKTQQALRVTTVVQPPTRLRQWAHWSLATLWRAMKVSLCMLGGAVLITLIYIHYLPDWLGCQSLSGAEVDAFFETRGLTRHDTSVEDAHALAVWEANGRRGLAPPVASGAWVVCGGSPLLGKEK